MKNKRTIVDLLLVISMLSIVLVGCNSQSNNSTETDGSTDVLTVYTARSENLNNAVIPNFEKDTGIKVEIVVAGTGELLKRVESEKDNPMADVLWAADETMLSSSKDLFMKYVSPEDENMMDDFKNKTGYFSPAFADPTVFIVNKDLIGNIKMEGFEDLLNPELKGKIAFGDPANSSSAFQSLVAMLYAMGNGDPMSDEAWDFVDKFIKNLDGKMIGSSGQVHKGVADGEYPVGLTWEDPAANYIKNGAPVEVVFPKEGAIFPGESVQIIKNCNNPEGAKKFVDYLLSEKIQNLVGSELTVRSLTELASYSEVFNILEADMAIDNEKNYISFDNNYREEMSNLNGSVRNDMKVLVSVRPQEFIINLDGVGIRGTVKNSMFLGLTTHYFVELANGKEVEVIQDLDSSEIIPEGTEVYLKVKPNKINVFHIWKVFTIAIFEVSALILIILCET